MLWERKIRIRNIRKTKRKRRGKKGRNIRKTRRKRNSINLKERKGADRRIHEEGEKELLKHDEEIGRQDALSYIVWAAILGWGGITFLSIKNGWLETIFSSNLIAQFFPESAAVMKPCCVWSFIMLGVGVILLVEVAARLLIHVFPYHNGETIAIGAVFIGVGLRNIFGWDYLWVFFLVSVGASILLNRFMRQRS